MLIREASIPTELPAIRDLFQEYAAGLGLDLEFQGFAQEVAQLPGGYARPRGGIWLAVAGGQVAGCIALRSLDAAACEMKRLYVRPAFRGQGIGRRLAETVLHAAQQACYRRICLDTLPTMASAVALYRELGFSEIEPYCHNPVPGAMFFGRELA